MKNVMNRICVHALVLAVVGLGFHSPAWAGANGTAQTQSATGGAGAGKIKFNEFTIKKTTDKASPLFFKNCTTGAHYPQTTIQVRKAGGDPTTAGKPFLKYQFGTVFTTK